MEMLNSATMLLSAGGLWGTLIDVFAKWIVNYGWAIIVFTIALKLVLSPLDFLQRKSTAKQQKVMNAMKPEMDKLQAKYGNNREKLNQETAKLYKKYNMGAGGMCLTMLLTLVLTMVIFFTLFSSLRSYGDEKLYSNYEKLETVYIQAEENGEDVKQAVLDEYKIQSKQNSWLWVKNVWKSDTNTDQLVDFDDYAKHKEWTGDLTVQEARYDVIAEIVEDENPGQNGYYILLILAVVISFLTQFLSAKLMTPKGQKLNTMNKVMFAVIPISMVMFAATSNVVFTLYIITNSVMSAIVSTALFFITKPKNKADGNNQEVLLQKKNIQVVEYSRNYKK